MQVFAAVPSTCFTKEVDAGLTSAAFDCAAKPRDRKLDSSSRLINLCEIRVHVTNASGRETIV